MFSRFRRFLPNQNFFLFGPRGTGKSTLLKQRFDQKACLWLDLLDTHLEDQFFRRPDELFSIVKALPQETRYIVIAEIQKVPRLLDEVHRLIEETEKIFILTGSSARKLYCRRPQGLIFDQARQSPIEALRSGRGSPSPGGKGDEEDQLGKVAAGQKSNLEVGGSIKHGGANLLAGRAFVYHLYPLSCFELQNRFDLHEALQWGTLPKIYSLKENSAKDDFLRAYGDTYLKEEIWNERVIRKLQPFRRFLEVAAQCNGKIINYANIARDVGVDDKTIKEYYSILEDTMIGFFLEPFHNSFRKRLVEKPKFYFFDPGVVRSLSRRLSIPLIPQTSAYGDAFEHYILLEFIRLGSYFQPDYRFSYIRTPADVEVDLVVERPGKPLLCIEIKSSDSISESDISSFSRLTKDIPNCEAIVLSQDRFMKKFAHVTCYPWKQGLIECFPETADRIA